MLDRRQLVGSGVIVAAVGGVSGAVLPRGQYAKHDAWQNDA